MVAVSGGMVPVVVAVAFLIVTLVVLVVAVALEVLEEFPEPLTLFEECSYKPFRSNVIFLIASTVKKFQMLGVSLSV